MRCRTGERSRKGFSISGKSPSSFATFPLPPTRGQGEDFVERTFQNAPLRLNGPWCPGTRAPSSDNQFV